jgi:Trans-aconitate methyltransferase
MKNNEFKDWQPGRYLRFHGERTQPTIDLAKRVGLADPKRILDLGCGPGNSTAVLSALWPEAEIVGLDNSETMLAEAGKTSSHIRWILHDAAEDMAFLGKFDIVFSNAALQWLPDNEQLIPRLYGMLNPGGVLAVQVPYSRDLPAFTVLKEVTSRPEWREFFTDPTVFRLHHDYRFYYNVLCRLPGKLDLWQTEYIHIMDSADAVLEWYKGTGLRPFMQKLADEAVRERFLQAYAQCIGEIYRAQDDGKVLFPFKRIFFVKERES